MREVGFYNYACVLPVIQQIVAGSNGVRNIIGLIKDIFHAVITLKSFETINLEFNIKQKLLLAEIESLELLQKSNELLMKTLRDADTPMLTSSLEGKAGMDKGYLDALKLFEEQQKKFELLPLSEHDRQTLRIVSSGSDYSKNSDKFKNKYWEVHMQMNAKISNLQSQLTILWILETVPLFERIKDLAIDIISFTPGLGTAYNLYLIKTASGKTPASA